MPLAITRQVSPRFDQCELTHIPRVLIDIEIASAQHRNYTQALESLGCRVIELPAQPEFPDSVFVEDTAIILPEAAIITRPGAPSRRGETETIKEVLAPYRDLIFIQSPATLDGGDVLVLDRDIYIGLSTRSSLASVEQLQALLSPFGYRAFGVQLSGCLHLKSAVTRIEDSSLLINRDWVDGQPFEHYELVDVAPSEPHAANILMLGVRGIYPAAFPETLKKLLRRGLDLITVDLSELAKAEGAVTCCSLIL